MHAAKKTQAMDYITAQPWPGDFKRQVLAGWAKVTGAAVAVYESNTVAASGWDLVRHGG